MSLTILADTCCPQILRPAYERIRTSHIGSRLARGFFWSIAGVVISRGLMFLSSIIVARLLGKTVFGELGMIKSTIGMFGVFAAFGLGLTANKHIAEFRQKDPVRAGHFLSLSGLVAIVSGGLISLVVLAFAPWIAGQTINAPHLAGTLRVSALILFASALNGAQTGALAGFEAFKTIAYVNLLAGIISFPILVVGTFFGGLTGAVWALAISMGVNWLLNHLMLRKEAANYGVPFTFRGCGKEWPTMWRFSLPAALASMMIAPFDWACRAFLVNQADGYGEMAIFSAANQWCFIILFIPSMLWKVVLPLMSELNGQSRITQYQKLIRLNIILNVILASIIIVPLAVFAKLAMSAYGQGYENGANTLRVLAIAALLTAVNSVADQAMVSKGKMWTKLMFDIMKGIVFISATFLLIHAGYGAAGLASASLISCAFLSILLVVYLRTLLYKSDSVPKARDL